MAEQQAYVATLRAVIFTADEVEANVTAERLREECESLLDTEEGDEVVLTQVTATSSDLTPEETLVVLRRARNALIRTRIKQCWDLAREMDAQLFWLKRRLNPGDLTNYDYGRFIEIAESILQPQAQQGELLE